MNKLVQNLVKSVFLLAILYCSGSFAAGQTTHMMMGDMARFKLPAGHPLIALLEAHRPALLAGAMFPDGGYFTGSGFSEDRDLAETAHWGGFTNALAKVAHDKGCGDLANSSDAWDAIPVAAGTVDWVGNELGRETNAIPIRIGDSCGYLVAFLMGVAAHGMGDEVWDALFEPTVYQRGEIDNSSPASTLDVFPPGADPSVGAAIRAVIGDDLFDALKSGVSVAAVNSVEYAMDVIAIRDQFNWDEVPFLVVPPPGDIALAFTAMEKPQHDEVAVQRASLGGRLIVTAERIGAAVDYNRVRQQMPYAVQNYITGSGGIQDTAEYIAGYYQHLWQKVIEGVENSPKPFVVGVHPRAGERGLPANPCVTDVIYSTCDDTVATGKRPLADRYIYVSMSSTFDGSIKEVKDALVVFDEEGNKLPASVDWLPGWANGGSAHGFRLKLDNPVLKPNHRYTVVVTTQIYDFRGAADDNALLEAPFIWHFSTGAE